MYPMISNIIGSNPICFSDCINNYFLCIVIKFCIMFMQFKLFSGVNRIITSPLF